VDGPGLEHLVTDETTPQTSDETSAETAPAAAASSTRPRRRRATAPAGTPSGTTASADVAEPEAGPPAAEEPQAPKRRSRRPAASAEADEGDTPPAKRTRTASTKTKTKAKAKDAGATAEPESAAPESPTESGGPAGDDSGSTAAEPQKAKAGTRRRRASSKVAEDAGDEASSGDRAKDLDVLAELGSAAVLFQAPEPVKRRRAQAPAGPPRPADEADGEGGEEPDETAEAESAEKPEPEASGGARRSRQRRSRSGAAEPEGGNTEAPEATVAESEEDSDEESDETGGDEGEPREGARRRRRRRGGRGRRRSADGEAEETGDAESPEGEEPDEESGDTGGEDGEAREGGRRRRRRRRSGRSGGDAEPRRDEVTALKGSTRLEAKRQRRREGRDAGRRRAVLSEAEFLARRESVERAMVVREAGGRVQIAVLEDGVLVEHFVSRAGGGGQSSSSMIGNVYLGRVQNVLPSMEAAFVDVGKGRNAVLYAGEVNWDAAGLEGQPRRIEQALKSGDSVLVQVTKDPVGHKGARLTSQVTLAGRYLVYVPAGGMTGISRKLPENERARLKKLLKEIVPEGAGVIVRTAAEGASEEELRRDVKRLQDQWAAIEKKQKSASAPALLQGEPDLAIRVVRDIFNDDFSSLTVQGEGVWRLIHEYVESMAPDLLERVGRWTGDGDVFASHRIDEQLSKGMDRKVWLPSGGSLVIDRTEAMTVIDVNTGKFTGSGGTLEETVTRNNLEAAEEIVRQLRLRDIGGIIVIDFIDMVLESNRDLVLRRLVECLGRDRTKHQVAEVTSLGLVQMTRKRVGQGLVEAFSETCQHCAGRGYLIHTDPVEAAAPAENGEQAEAKRSRRSKRPQSNAPSAVPVLPEAREAVKATLATIAAAAAHAHDHDEEQPRPEPDPEMIEALALEVVQRAEAAGADDASAGSDGEGAESVQDTQDAEQSEPQSDAQPGAI